MNICKYYTIRSKKGKKYMFCRFCKINIGYTDCTGCEYKIYKSYKKNKKKKHERTKRTEIQKGVKEIVWRRDNYRCIFCKCIVDKSHANAHFIPRSQGGLGIEENIFTACDKCHGNQDNGLNTLMYEQYAEDYLKSIYPDWKKENLIFTKY